VNGAAQSSGFIEPEHLLGGGTSTGILASTPMVASSLVLRTPPSTQPADSAAAAARTQAAQLARDRFVVTAPIVVARILSRLFREALGLS
jgi:hypothetical protein